MTDAERAVPISRAMISSGRKRLKARATNIAASLDNLGQHTHLT
jgi:hypothetical protein